MGYTGIQIAPCMRLYQHAAVNQSFFYGVSAFVCYFVSFRISLHPFYTVGRKRPEEILLIIQHNRIPAGNGHRRRNQNAFVLLENRTIFRRQKDGAATLIDRNSPVLNLVWIGNGQDS